MTEYRLHQNSKPEYQSLLFELRNSRRNPVFRTFVPDGEEMTIFCTTNERVHLALGKLVTPAGLRKLAKIFKAETVEGHGLLFSFDSGDPEPPPKSSLFVTGSKNEDGETIFHLAPGR